jgi:hypothetical protein
LNMDSMKSRVTVARAARLLHMAATSLSGSMAMLKGLGDTATAEVGSRGVDGCGGMKATSACVYTMLL